MSREDEGIDALDVLAEAFVAQRRSGKHPSVDDYAARHPELADDIRRVFPLLGAMEALRDEVAAPRLPGDGRVGPYTIVREIGRGGMGVVYEAVQEDLGRRVALKILPARATLDPRFLARFRLEAQAAARLRHPQIVPVIGYGQHEDLHYFSMAFIEGRGVDALIREAMDRFGTGPRVGTGADVRAHFHRVAELGRLAAGAIAHAHGQGILHRDVKPSNLLLDEDENLWVADFGLCSIEGSDGLTASGDVLGTWRYLPPERFTGVSDARGDVYGIGITLYELLTRRRAYEGDDPAVLTARITAGGPPRPRALDPRIPADLETVVRRAMAHDAADRYPTAEALAADLSAWLDGRPIAARAPTFGYLIRKAIRRHKALATTALLAVLALLGSSVWYVLTLREKEARARLGQYVANIAAVEAARQTADVRGALDLLEAAPPEFRNWEWYQLQSRLDSELRAFPSRPVTIHDVEFHPSGAWFAATLGDQTWVYDDATGGVVERLETPAAQCLAWSPDGSHLAVGMSGGIEVRTWPAARRVFAAELEGEVRHLDYAAGGREIVCALVEGTILTLDAQDGGEVHRLRLPTRVLALACDREQDTIVVGSADGRLRLYTRPSWTLAWSHEVSAGGVSSVAFLPGGRVGCATREGGVLVFDAGTGRGLRGYAVGREAGFFLRDPLDLRDLVFGPGRIHVFDSRSSRRLRVLEGRTRPHTGAVQPDGRRVVVASPAGTLEEWYLGDGTDPQVLEGHVDDVMTARFDPGGRRIASGGFGGEVRVWDADTGELARVLPGHVRAVNRLRFSPGGRWLVSGDWAGEVLLRDARTLALVRRWQAHEGAIFGLAWRPGDAQLLTLGREGVLRLWDAETGRLRHESDAAEAGARALALQGDGQWVAVGDEDGTIRLHRAEDLGVVRRFAGHRQAVRGLAFSPDGRRLASVSEDQTLRVWDPGTGRELGRFARHDPDLAPQSEALVSVAWSPDASRIATGANSGHVSLWDPASGQRLVTFHPDWCWISELEFSPDGSRLLAALTNSQVRIWDTRPVREWVGAYERAAELRCAARPIVEDLAAHCETPDACVEAVLRYPGVDDAVRESAVRLVHQRAGSRDGLFRWAWRVLVPATGDADERRAAYGLARGLYRASRHREEEDPRADSLLGLAALRGGDAEVALRVLERTAPRNRTRARELYAVDLTVITLAHLAREEPDDARGHLDELDALLAAEPELATARVRTLEAEARAALEAAR